MATEYVTETRGEKPVEGINNSRSYRGNRSLKESRINRHGLSRGAPAPGFTLPCPDGGHLSLEDYCGRKVLLIFSDPECGPCNRLLPQLKALAHRTPDIQILLISRGDLESNRLKVREYELSFPVVLQRQWEISRLYAMFATPMAYLIDEKGIIVSDVAVGESAILTLLIGAQIQALLNDAPIPFKL